MPDFDRDTSGGRRWLKITGIVVALLLLLAVVIMLVSGGEHGPRRHSLDAGNDRIDGLPAGPSPALLGAIVRAAVPRHLQLGP